MTNETTEVRTLPSNEGFEQTEAGKEVHLYYLQNGLLKAAVTNYGARLVSLLVPDKNGEPLDVVIGLDSIERYKEARSAFFGATVGRYANRIAFGKFSLNGQQYQLATNLGRHHLHGGIHNFQEVVWDAGQPDEATVVFSYLSEDGEEGYPGNLHITVTYQLTAQNELVVHFEAKTDKPTVVNLTNHSYFNLNGQGNGTILDHMLQINADYFTPTDAESIPKGTVQAVAGTPFDFREPMPIGARIDADNEQINFGSGYDHNFVLNKREENELSFAARATGDQSGVVMEVHTTEPGMQLYCANFQKGTIQLRNGTRDIKNCGFCLETQHYPDSPNQPAFPSTVLKEGEKFDSRTVFRFLI